LAPEKKKWPATQAIKSHTVSFIASAAYRRV